MYKYLYRVCTSQWRAAGRHGVRPTFGVHVNEIQIKITQQFYIGLECSTVSSATGPGPVDWLAESSTSNCQQHRRRIKLTLRCGVELYCWSVARAGRHNVTAGLEVSTVSRRHLLYPAGSFQVQKGRG